MEHLEDLADVVSALDRVPQRPVAADPVGVAAAFAQPVQVTGLDEIAHDALRCPLGDTHPLGDIAQPQSGIAGDAHQGVGVVGQERPLGHGRNSTYGNRPGRHRHARMPHVTRINNREA